MEEKHVEILLEDIRGKFDLVLEGHDVLRHEIQRTREELKVARKFRGCPNFSYFYAFTDD